MEVAVGKGKRDNMDYLIFLQKGELHMNTRNTFHKFARHLVVVGMMTIATPALAQDAEGIPAILANQQVQVMTDQEMKGIVGEGGLPWAAGPSNYVRPTERPESPIVINWSNWPGVFTAAIPLSGSHLH